MALRFAADVANMAKKIINEFHPQLEETPIVFFFEDKGKRKGGKNVLGYARLLTESDRSFLAALQASGSLELDDSCSLPMILIDCEPKKDGEFRLFPEGFAITIHLEAWCKLLASQKKALVDHELCHCFMEFDENNEPKLSMRGHDIEEFADIVARHGLWKQDLEDFATVTAKHFQPNLFDGFGADGVTTTLEVNGTKVTFGPEDSGALKEAAKHLKDMAS